MAGKDSPATKCLEGGGPFSEGEESGLSAFPALEGLPSRCERKIILAIGRPKVANKDKGGSKGSKKAPSKSLKEKRKEKKAKQAAASSK